jgi:hypothetical protein
LILILVAAFIFLLQDVIGAGEETAQTQNTATPTVEAVAVEPTGTVESTQLPAPAFYLMGGGGVYQFRNIGASSSLTGNFPGIDESSKSEVKWGLTGGAGLEVHVIGASSLYLQTAFTSVSAGGRNLNWVPVNIGVMLR